MNKSMTRLVVALIAFLLVTVVAVPIVQGVINNKQSTDIGGGKDGKDGEDGITPQLRINYSTNEWEYSYTQGVTWQSLGVKATGAAGKDGADGVNGTNGTDGKDGQDGQDGKDGVSPRIRINTSTSEWEISTDEGLTWESTGVKASGEVTTSLTIDSELSTTSENAVQNKVITETLNQYLEEIGASFEQLVGMIQNVTVTVPTFDLVALGLPPVNLNGLSVSLETDTTEIMTALEKGPVKFIVSLDNGDSTSINVEIVLNCCFVDGMFMCQHVVDFIGGHPFLANVIVMEGVVGATVYDLNQGDTSVLPDVTTDDDGKGLIVQDGEWVVGELPDTPTQEKTIEITESGTYEIMPDAGYALSKVLATVNIATSGDSSSGSGETNYRYYSGAFNLDYSPDVSGATWDDLYEGGTLIVPHDIGEVPDVFLLYGCPSEPSKIASAVGFSNAMLEKLGGGNLCRVSVSGVNNNILTFSSTVGIENEPVYPEYGLLRNFTKDSFTIGSDSKDLQTHCTYVWIAICGLT